MSNVRAKKRSQGKNDDDFRWFHLVCYQKDNSGWDSPIDFPSEARSGHTRCFGCGNAINTTPEPVAVEGELDDFPRAFGSKP